MGEVGYLKDGNFQNLQVEGIKSISGNIRYKRNIISGLAATRAFTAEESGSIIFLDDLNGAYTLPPAEAGLEYYFVCGGVMAGATITCADDGAASVTTTDRFFGTIKVTSTTDNKVSADQTVAPGGTASNSNVLTLNGDSTQHGGQAGDTLHVVAIDAANWLVAGVLTTSGVTAAALAILT
jgi:hypothetical protein